jgi:competence protein ComEC
MRSFLSAALAALLTAALLPAKTFDIYLLDVEGGKSVLMISPSGESLLYDAGWPALQNREASVNRIVEAAQQLALKQIDYLVISHFDVDHMGDIPQLVSKIPVRHIVDHGTLESNPNMTEPRYKAMIAGETKRFEEYSAVRAKVDHMVAKPGDKIPFKGIDVTVLSAGGQTIKQPLPGAGQPNQYCASNPQQPVIDRDVEDNLSVGLLFTYGKFRMLDLADLEAHNARELVCPNNLIGAVELYNVNVHAQFKGIAPELVNAIHARVMIVGNGAKKGGDPPSWPVLRQAPGLEDIWQSHYSVAAGDGANPAKDFIANQDETEGKWIKVSVEKNGSFTVFNSRNNFHKTYQGTR